MIQRVHRSLPAVALGLSVVGCSEGGFKGANAPAKATPTVVAPSEPAAVAAVEPPPAEEPPVATKAPLTLKMCAVENVQLPLNLVQESNTPKGKWHAGTATLALPADAKDIKLAIVYVLLDDNQGQVWFNGKLAVDRSKDDASYGSYHLLMPGTPKFNERDMYLPAGGIAIGALLLPGANKVTGRVFDAHGVYASLTLKVSGSYQTGGECTLK